MNQKGAKITKKRAQIQQRRQRPTLTKHAPAWADPMFAPLLECPFSLKNEHWENMTKKQHKNAFWRIFCEKLPKSDPPKGGPPVTQGSPGLPRIAGWTFFWSFYRLIFLLTNVHPRSTKKEYNGELGPQNDSKMEPKMEPRRQRPTLTKHAPAWADPMFAPLLEGPFSLKNEHWENMTKKQHKNTL